ncbi:MAG: trypsin-like serine protease [Candidatus Hydrogenedens sp.]|nr:trypsin-like serine protease [Candidatus Hydrogenedens sp.]
MNRGIQLALCALALCLVSGGVFAEASIDDSRRTAIVRAIEDVSPAVVTINVVDIQYDRVVDPRMSDFFNLFGPRLRGAARERQVEGVGTGFVFDADGHILTNYHVLQDADLISSVTLSDGRQIEVEFVGADERTDIAILQAKTADLPFAPLGESGTLMTGEWVIAIGNPFANMMRDPQPTVSVGVVSANHRQVSREVGGGDRLYQNLIQTDAAINPGNSGGPLVNAAGQVVGVNTMIFSNTGGNQGLGFAIPIDRVKRVADEIVLYGRRRNPWMGFRGEPVAAFKPFAKRELGVQSDDGVLVTEIMRDCPAYRAGLRLGDVIVGFNGQAVTHPTDIDYINWDLYVGDAARLLVERDGQTQRFEYDIEELDQK